MLRFIKHTMTTISGIEIYPMISLIIFGLFFAVILVRAIRMIKQEINELSNIPFDEEELKEIPSKSSNQ